MEDVPVLVDWLERPSEGAAPIPEARRSFYAVLDGHGGRDAADFVASRLPALLAEGLAGVSSGSSAEIKAGIKKCFLRCDEELLRVCEANDWVDGCCAIAVLIDAHCSPPRAYVANLGDSRAFACMADGAAAPRAVPLSKDHSPLNPAERKRIEQAGGFVEDGRVCGSLEVSRSLGDRRLKGSGLSAAPDLTSFPLTENQPFLLLGCDGFWKVFSGQQAVEWMCARLPKMDERRDELRAQLSDQASVSALTKEALAALHRERDTACEVGLLRELLHEAVHARNAKDNCTVLLVRLSRG